MSVSSNFLCGCPHGADPLPLSACIHMSLSLPLLVNVINGWPLTRLVISSDNLVLYPVLSSSAVESAFELTLLPLFTDVLYG